ncbi:DUF1127 domain-containing protein [Geopsychrobacter electrodiphilus]|uniref:DUF1127 domain-containing protein n=1 Tax=Geopsychrobacter electrodiphilus TaxID=225196 RepID=UPI00037973C1|nr:DUF1127 domain-containing protein [Geopsychrobacter electrodiphilus]
MKTQHCMMQQVECPARKTGHQLKSYWNHLTATFQRWNELTRQRRQLREMEEHILKDIGISRADAERIAGRRWFWQDPLNRKEDLDQRYRSSDRVGRK